MTVATATPKRRILDHDALLEIIPLSRTTLWRMERAGEFPRRIKVSKNRVGWFESDVAAWLDARRHHDDND
jgi:predicted DNA-binding transcriptional regulator AlpA